MANLNSLMTTRKLILRSRASVATLSSVLCAMIAVLGISLFASTPVGADNRQGATYENSASEPAGSPTLDMSDDEYNSEYLFGLSRSVAGSTMNAGVKTLFFVFTIPVDIVVLPFAAIGGFF